MFADWSLRLRVFLFFLFLGLAALVLIGAGLWLGWSRSEPRSDMAPFMLGGLAAGFAVLGLVAWIWRLFDENLARPMQILASRMRILAAGERGAPLAEEDARYLGDLAPAAKAIAERLAETQSDLTLAIRRETQSLAEEKERLETLLADVSVGVILCSADHNVVFYNSLARGQLEHCAAPRLDQPITNCLREGPLLLAHAQIAHAAAGHDEAEFYCTTTDGSTMFAASMRLVPQGNDRAGSYVLTLQDVTAQSGAALGRESLLTDMVDDMRRRAAGLETLVALQDRVEDALLAKALLDETHQFASAVETFAQRFEASRSAALTGRRIAARDLADGVSARLRGAGLDCDATFADLTLAADGFMIAALMAHLSEQLRDECDVGSVLLDISEDTEGAMVSLSWEGDVLEVGQLERWLDVPLEMGEGAFPARFILSRHGSEMWPEAREGRAVLRLPLGVADPRADHALRGAVYDFSLFEKSRLASLADMPIDALAYVVFDTETTGLLPTQGDEIVQIAAMRLLGARIVEGEVLNTFVDPGRAIPAASTKVHGITQDMVAGAPDIAEAGAELHAFAHGAVLVAHNAPFDMAFFHKHADVIGREFDNPVLDTVLLSAVLFGITEQHTLDALCERLGIEIPEALRHTAMGDTRATAESFAKMLGLLQARGLTTFGAVHAEMKKQMRLYRGRDL
ncbi:exonuclease domain-containing protein [Primorskyibacter sp. S187A]|uniref:3'-5' exonuclease n=1 Tax=Primorskyibacter sp. S187A TaxID=3415130 RepID=UPI003C7A8008